MIKNIKLESIPKFDVRKIGTFSPKLFTTRLLKHLLADAIRAAAGVSSPAGVRERGVARAPAHGLPGRARLDDGGADPDRGSAGPDGPDEQPVRGPPAPGGLERRGWGRLISPRQSHILEPLCHVVCSKRVHRTRCAGVVRRSRPWLAVTFARL